MAIRRRRWAPGRLPFAVRLPGAGLDLGTDATGTRLTFPLLVSTTSTRVGVVDNPQLTRLLTLRLLADSCDLAVVTSDADSWQRLARSAHNTPFAVSSQIRSWPPENSPAPWALIVDMPDPPPPGFARKPWCTVIHSAPAVPPASRWWQSANLVLATRKHIREVATSGPRVELSAGFVDGLGADDVVAVTQTGVLGVFRVSASGEEYRLLRRAEPEDA